MQNVTMKHKCAMDAFEKLNRLQKKNKKHFVENKENHDELLSNISHLVRQWMLGYLLRDEDKTGGRTCDSKAVS